MAKETAGKDANSWKFQFFQTRCPSAPGWQSRRTKAREGFWVETRAGTLISAADISQSGVGLSWSSNLGDKDTVQCALTKVHTTQSSLSTGVNCELYMTVSDQWRSRAQVQTTASTGTALCKRSD